MASQTQIVCLCEGTGGSIDPIFINRLLKSLRPSWVKPWVGNNIVRIDPCGGRNEVIRKLPVELRRCSKRGGSTTLMVWADCDHDCADGEELKTKFWEEAKRCEIGREDFDRVVFIFAKDRLENWIEYLEAGATDEATEGRRVKKSGRIASEAARRLAEICQSGQTHNDLPPSLQWSCKSWQSLADKMK